MPIKNAIHSQQVYDPTDESIMAEQELCMDLKSQEDRYGIFSRPISQR